MEKTYYKNLDALRAIAALVVIHAHLPITYNFDTKNIIQPIWALTKTGDNAVYFFFVLSGFLITNIILNDNASNNFNLLTFYMRRVLRIWPLYFLLLLLNFVVVLPLLSQSSSHTYFNYQLWKHILFISNYDIINVFKHNLPFLQSINITWSISIEEQFYLFWPVIFLFIKENKYRFFAILIILITLLYFGYKLEPSKWYYFTTPSGMIYLSFGGLIAIANFMFNKTYIKIPLYISILSYVLSIAYLAKYIPSSNNTNIDIILKCAIMGFFIIDQALNENRLFNLRKIPLLNGIGKISYGIYLLHPICFLLIDYILSKTVGYGMTRNICIVLIGIPFIYSVCLISYQYESYFLKLKTKFK